MASLTMHHTPAAADAALPKVPAIDEPSPIRDYKGFVSGVFSGLAKLSGAFSINAIASTRELKMEKKPD